MAAQEKDQPPGELSAEVVAAWKKAGAKIGWLGRDRHPDHFEGANDGLLFTNYLADVHAAGAVPAFRLESWDAGILAKLPAPERVFGLELTQTKELEGELKGASRFKKLALLRLGKYPFYHSGDRTLKALREIGLLHALANAWAADEKRPGGPAEVVSLDLHNDSVTDEGLKELVDFKNLASTWPGRGSPAWGSRAWLDSRSSKR